MHMNIQIHGAQNSHSKYQSTIQFDYTNTMPEQTRGLLRLFRMVDRYRGLELACSDEQLPAPMADFTYISSSHVFELGGAGFFLPITIPSSSDDSSSSS